MIKALSVAALMACVSTSALAQTAPVSGPWLDKTKSADERAKAAVAAMTLDEKLSLIMGYTDPNDLMKQPDDIVPPAVKADVKAHHIAGSAGYILGVPRLGITPQWQTDASIGVRVTGMERTALPSSLATAASFDPAVSEAGGKMIATEAKASGFNVFLAGGSNLAREPRNGRNFEYVGEDPLLAGRMAGGLIKGIQSTHMVSTMKHFAVNDQESQRTTVDATISVEAMRQSDLLAFEFVKEIAEPGSVMCSYNLVNGRWACENDFLLNKTLKQDWNFKGFVMADWGAVHSTADAANNGLDQFTGYPCCGMHGPFFAAKPFKAALDSGQIPPARLDDMATRILWPLFATGVFDDPAKVTAINFKADFAVSQTAAEDSLVLLKNDGNLLPLGGVKSVAMIGSHADKGVMAGSGSSSVTPVGGNAVPGIAPTTWPGPVVYMPSSPVEALKAEMPKTTKIAYDSGDDIAAAVALAQKSDVAVVFVTQWMGEGFDNPLELQGNQDALVAAVVKANPKTIVVVESGGAVLMPWVDQVPAVLEAFYPGIRGGQAIARILTGKVNPSGHLPVSFPASNDQLAHDIPGYHIPDGKPVSITYDEGATIGYKWYDVKGYKPLYAFGHGLSYTSFDVGSLKPSVDGGTLKISFSIRNTGKVAGKGVAQVYVGPADWRAAGWEAPKRLGGFAKADLKPGNSQSFEVSVDPRLLATYLTSSNSWTIKAGTYHVMLGQASDDLPVTADVTLPDMTWSAVHKKD